MTPTRPTPAEPGLRVLNPDATAEEIAAIITVLAALGSTPAPAPRRPRSEWASPTRAVRRPLTAGPGAWRASGLPH